MILSFNPHSQTLNVCEILRSASGSLLVSRTDEEGWTYKYYKAQNCREIRNHKGGWLILTVARRPWKTESDKESVTTHLPNESAPKMDCTALCSRVVFSIFKSKVECRKIPRLNWRLDVSLIRSIVRADLGSSSSYLSCILKDRWGEGFLVNIAGTRVNRKLRINYNLWFRKQVGFIFHNLFCCILNAVTQRQ